MRNKTNVVVQMGPAVRGTPYSVVCNWGHHSHPPFVPQLFHIQTFPFQHWELLHCYTSVKTSTSLRQIFSCCSHDFENSVLTIEFFKAKVTDLLLVIVCMIQFSLGISRWLIHYLKFLLKSMGPPSMEWLPEYPYICISNCCWSYTRSHEEVLYWNDFKWSSH